ncbi:MAG: alpha/beta fold hydrolase BchO [Rubrivivax sp.]|nr:alpha/beta fold hydrolase BchO [Rubrivivax sp.]
MDWQREGPSWPHHERSHFVTAAGQRWHVQTWPTPTAHAPTLLLLHGTGASTHSWRDLAPLLAPQAGVIAVDLPGHGFSGPAVRAAHGDGATLPGMARGVRALLATIGTTPTWLVGHSAGAAIAVRMALDDAAGLHGIVSLNGALLPLHGLAGQVFSPMAKLLALNPLVPRFFAWRAGDPVALQRLIVSTGSTLDASGAALYRRLVSNPRHVAGALRMMARWDLHTLQQALPRLSVPLHQIAGERDRTVPPANARYVQQMLAPAAKGTLTVLPGLGHLAHEEQPRAVVELLLGLLAQAEPAATPRARAAARST